MQTRPSVEDQKVWCLIEVPAENTKTGRWYELCTSGGAPGSTEEDRATQVQERSALHQQEDGKPFSDRLWRDGLFEAMVEAGLAHGLKTTPTTSGRSTSTQGKPSPGIPSATPSSRFHWSVGGATGNSRANCDTSMQYVEQHIHYDAQASDRQTLHRSLTPEDSDRRAG